MLKNITGGKQVLRLIQPSGRCIPTARQESYLAQEFERATKEATAANVVWQTPESDPGQHTLNHEGLFYTIPDQDYQRWCAINTIDHHRKMLRAFGEHSLMVRRSAVEIMHYLKNSNLKLPAIRYILYGEEGSGKSMTLAHISHYCGSRGWIVAHFPTPAQWVRYGDDASTSSYNPERVDTPKHAAYWLSKFVAANEQTLKSLNLKLANTYIWNRRERAEAGTSIGNVINMGLERIKYSSDCVGAILKELKHHATAGNLKLLLTVDGVNGLWRESRIKMEYKIVPTESMTLVHNLKKILKSDWSGGATVCTVDVRANVEGKKESVLPRYLLGKEGFEHLDPFLPVQVKEYSDKEILSCIEYYIKKKWILNPKALTENGKNQLKFLSCNNPYALMKATASW